MKVEIGTEAAQFLEKEYINWIFVAVQSVNRRGLPYGECCGLYAEPGVIPNHELTRGENTPPLPPYDHQPAQVPHLWRNKQTVSRDFLKKLNRHFNEHKELGSKGEQSSYLF
jgi:hypothetical protein